MATAEERSPEYPLARVVDQWVLLNHKGSTVSKGKGSVKLIQVLDEYEDYFSRVLGLNARAVLKGAAVEAMTNGVIAPMWTWYFTSFENSPARVFDPVEMLTSGFKEKMDVTVTLGRLGMPSFVVPGPEVDPEQSAKFVLDLSKRLGIA